MKNAANYLLSFDASIIEYTSYADTSNTVVTIFLYWEVSHRGEIPPSVFEYCCLTIEESLSNVYRQGRVWGSRLWRVGDVETHENQFVVLVKSLLLIPNHLVHLDSS